MSDKYIENYVSIIKELEADLPEFDTEELFTVESFPNPCQNESRLRICLSQDEEIEISLLNLEGKLIYQLLENTSLYSGTYLYSFDFSELRPGIYFYQIYCKSKVISKKLIIL